MENDFHVTLTSNACTDYFPSNTVGRFSNLLAHPLELTDGGDGRGWEVGLKEVSFPGYRTPLALKKEDYIVTFMERDRLHEPETPREPDPASLQSFEMNHFLQIVGFEKSMQFVFTKRGLKGAAQNTKICLLYTSPSPRDS